MQNPALNAAAQARLLEKKKEYEAVAALERASAQFVKRIDELADDFDVMADAGKGLCFAGCQSRSELTGACSVRPGAGAMAQHVQNLGIIL